MKMSDIFNRVRTMRLDNAIERKKYEDQDSSKNYILRMLDFHDTKDLALMEVLSMLESALMEIRLEDA